MGVVSVLWTIVLLPLSAIAIFFLLLAIEYRNWPTFGVLVSYALVVPASFANGFVRWPR